jgi:hypothetical protein
VENIEVELTGVSQELQRILNNYSSANPRLSLNHLSKKCGVPEPSLRRMAQGKAKTAPSIGNIVSLLSYVQKKNHFRDLIEINQGELRRHLETHFSFWGTEDLKQTDRKQFERLAKLLKDKKNYHFLRLAQTKNGLSCKVAERIFSADMGKVAANLIEAGFVKEIDGIYHAIKKNQRMPEQQFIENFKSTADRIRLDVNDGQNFYTSLVENINEEAYQRILGLLRDANAEIRQILADENSRGDIPAFYLGAFDRY